MRALHSLSAFPAVGLCGRHELTPTVAKRNEIVARAIVLVRAGHNLVPLAV